MTTQQLNTFNAASKAWTDALRTGGNFAPYRSLFETLDHSMLVAIPCPRLWLAPNERIL